MKATSIDARDAYQASGKVERDHMIILNVLTVYGDLTCMQISERSGMIGDFINYHECGRRLKELEIEGRIVPTGQRGPAPSGPKKAGVYRIVKD